MREKTRKWLNFLRQQEISAWFPLLAVLILLFAGFVAFHTTVRKEREVSGVVQHAMWRINDDTGQRYPYFEVVLDNDSLVRVRTRALTLPNVGDRVTVRKRKMLVGYTTYQWDGPPAQAEVPKPTHVSLP